MRTIAITLLLALLVTLAPCSTPAPGENYSFVTLREARDLLGRPGVYFIDVNEPEIYSRFHVPGATPVTSEELQKFLPSDKKSTLVFYCAERRCSGSHSAAHEAVKLGYTHVLVMPDGIFGWVNAGLPTERGAAK